MIASIIDGVKNASPLNVAIVCAAIVATIALILRKADSIKAGKDGIEFTKEKFEKDNRTVMVEIMNFTWKINSELTEGEQFYKKLIRREIKDQLYWYSNIMKTEYLSLLKEKYNQDYHLTYSSFTATLDGQCYMKMLQIFMDLYEHNHITQLSEQELRNRASEIYQQCTIVFKELFMEPWLEEMCDYNDLKETCQKLSPKVEEMCYKSLIMVRNTLRQLYALRTALQNVRNQTSCWIIEKGLLPPEGESLAENFFEPNKGLNVDNVDKYLKLITLE